MSENKCPKCGKKLGMFYLKPECPECGTVIMQYNFEERLENDRINAEKEWQYAENLIAGIKKSAAGTPYAITRLAALILSVTALLLPVYKTKDANINLIYIIKALIADSSSVFSDTAALLCFISFVSVVLTALACLIVSLFSFTKNGYKRNMIFSEASIAVFAVLSIAVCVNGAFIHAGFFAVAAMQALALFMHKKHNGVIKSGDGQ